MNKKVILGGIIAILLFGLGGVFFSDKLDLVKDESFDSTPTKWSQEEDYKIEDTPQGTLITNIDAKFSFSAPESWSIEIIEGILAGEYVVDMMPPFAKIKRDEYGNAVEFSGCVIALETVYHEIEVGNTKAGIYLVGENPEQNVTTEGIKEEVINVNSYSALRTTTSPSLEVFEKIGKFIWVKIPISDVLLIDISMRMMPGSEVECVPAFNKFLDSFSIQ